MKKEVLAMNRAIDVPDGIGGARRSLASILVQSTRHHRTLWIRVLYALTIIVVLALVAKLQ